MDDGMGVGDSTETRVRVRLGELTEVTDEEVTEAVRGVRDRLCLRVGALSLPEEAQSVVVDAACKVIRRKWYEGVSSESEGQGGSLSTSFVDDVLAEYADEIAGLRSMLAGTDALGRSKVRFI